MSEPTFADIAYGPHPRQRVDLWLPAGDGPWPLFLFLHGGGFMNGDKRKNFSDRFRERILRNGIATASANYRFATQAPYPAPMEDGARLVQHLRAHSQALRIDPDRLCMGGSSAGGVISAWVGYRPDMADPDASDTVLRMSTRPTCLYLEMTPVSMDPVYLRTLFPGERPADPVLQAFYGVDPAQWPTMGDVFADASPITHITPDAPPTFACCYQADTPCVPEMPPADRYHHPVYQRVLQDTLKQYAVPHEVHFLEETAPPHDPNTALATWEQLGIEWMQRWFTQAE